MPNAFKVRPDKWEDDSIIVLYDDNKFSVIWGKFKDNDEKVLGIRWNDSFPSQGAYPTWFVVPEFLNQGILDSILKKLQEGDLPDKNESIERASELLKTYS